MEETNRRRRREANERGLTIKGLNGEVRPAYIIGGNHRARKRPRVYVADPFAPITFPIDWKLVKAIANGHVTQIRIRPDNNLNQKLEERSECIPGP
jgi:hypothetical protein